MRFPAKKGPGNFTPKVAVVDVPYFYFSGWGGEGGVRGARRGEGGLLKNRGGGGGSRRGGDGDGRPSSFPATEPPDPRRASAGFLKGVSGGVFEGFLKGSRACQPKDPSKSPQNAPKISSSCRNR